MTESCTKVVLDRLLLGHNDWVVMSYSYLTRCECGRQFEIIWLHAIVNGWLDQLVRVAADAGTAIHERWFTATWDRLRCMFKLGKLSLGRQWKYFVPVLCNLRGEVFGISLNEGLIVRMNPGVRHQERLAEFIRKRVCPEILPIVPARPGSCYEDYVNGSDARQLYIIRGVVYTVCRMGRKGVIPDRINLEDFGYGANAGELCVLELRGWMRYAVSDENTRALLVDVLSNFIVKFFAAVSEELINSFECCDSVVSRLLIQDLYARKIE